MGGVQLGILEKASSSRHGSQSGYSPPVPRGRACQISQTQQARPPPAVSNFNPVVWHSPCVLFVACTLASFVLVHCPAVDESKIGCGLSACICLASVMSVETLPEGERMYSKDSPLIEIMIEASECVAKGKRGRVTGV